MPENPETAPAAPSAPEDHLAALGWDGGWAQRWDDFRARFQREHPGEHVLPARVVRVHRGACDVETPMGPQRVDVPAQVPVPHPTTGDWVGVRLDGPGSPVVVGVLPRRTVLARASVTGRSVDHQLAANVDTVVVTVAADARSTSGRVERLLALAWNSGAQPVVALTKADVPAPREVAARVAEVASDTVGAEVLAVSALDSASVDRLRERLSGTVVFLGSSGAGKSTLANALLGEDRFTTAAVRAVDGRGRHTTVTRELVALPGGLVLLDTPGLRTLGVADLEEGLERTFSDVEEVAVDCRFADCSHTAEPGCAVLAAIDAGVFSARRLESYRKLQREQEWFASRTDARLRAERRREWKQRVKVVRAHHR
ncbi:ribosome small subunit-dependent GTPase A [Kineococcus vitellinus]|uniref:ribosome small subunit-dependent GTPase A n=1 Tax=Kineococcus vitellinus TaxID=2696565 RepID=UPI0030B83FC9